MRQRRSRRLVSDRCCPSAEQPVALYGGKAIGIVLSGMLAAGVRGLRAIRRHGLVLAESASSAAHFSMPMSAIDLGKAGIGRSTAWPERRSPLPSSRPNLAMHPRANGGSRSIDRQ